MSDYRRVAGTGSIRIKDDETFVDDYGFYTVGGFAVIGPAFPSRELERGSKCVGGEVRFEIDLNAEYTVGGDVRIKGEARLFEGTGCNTMDLEATQSVDLIVPKDSTAAINISLDSTGTGGGDWAKGRISFTNIQQPEVQIYRQPLSS